MAPRPSAHWRPDAVIALECRTIVELASDYLDGDLDADRHRKVMAHLAGCDSCERYVDQVRQTVRLVGRLQRVEPGSHGSG
jgi:anti-sigma factor RsiW